MDYYDYYDDLDHSGIDYEIDEFQHLQNTETDDDFPLMSCITTSVGQIVSFILSLAMINLLYRLLVHWFLRDARYKHICSATLGFLSTYIFIQSGNSYLIWFSLLSYLFQQQLWILGFRKQGFPTLGFSIITILALELFEKDAILWHQIRGIIMILSMKNISIAFDLQASKIPKLPTILEYFGYLLCPASCIVGPWCSFNDYKNAQQNRKITRKLCLQLALNFLLAISFALASNCLVFMLPNKLGSYRDALGFRLSHYFISYMSQVQMMAAGFETNEKKLLGYQVTKPLDVELPRSLVQVVVSWNIPMHQFIRQYIFQNFKKYGKFPAILAAYVTSALLHGWNFQLAAVLLSLGFFTYIEFMLRSLLADVFNICIMANQCRIDSNGKCSRGHSNIDKKYLILMCNFLFGFVTMLNLTYLGVMFEASFSVQEAGFSFQNAISKWSELKFFGHILMGLSYFVYFILK